MNLRIRRSRRATRDLREIWTYIAVDSERAADRLLARIDGQFQLLTTNPLAGRVRPELGPALRSIPVGSYVIFYRADDEAIDVVRVLSGYLDTDPDDFT